jgi:hypothetical protein
VLNSPGRCNNNKCVHLTTASKYMKHKN